ncbi:hypothetical protein GCM10009624_10540 [Gordonia sinesedis]
MNAANDRRHLCDSSDMTALASIRRTASTPRTPRRLTAAVLAGVAASLLGAGLGAGTADASRFTSTSDGNYQISTNWCRGLSPNIIDNPYGGNITVTQYTRKGPGVADVGIVASQTFWGYANHMDIRWTNLRTKQRGALRGTQQATGAAGGTMKWFSNVRFGTGPVRIELRPSNQNALWTLPATSCSDTFSIR